MIGVVNRDKIFEFRDEDDLAKALDWFGSKYNCNTIIITDASKKVKGIICNGVFTFSPNLLEETHYYLFGSDVYNELDKNTELPRKQYEIDNMPFIYLSQRVPKNLDL